MTLISPLSSHNRLHTLWRKARWTDAEPAVQQLLALLPLLPGDTQQQAWQLWQTMWQTAKHVATLTPVSTLSPKKQKAKLFTRRKLDAIAFSNDLMAQLLMVSPETRAQWVKQVYTLI